jgi:hypothetical protein
VIVEDVAAVADLHPVMAELEQLERGWREPRGR